MKYDPLNSVSGFIAVLKPKGWSSNQLLSKLKWLFKTKKQAMVEHWIHLQQE